MSERKNMTRFDRAPTITGCKLVDDTIQRRNPQLELYRLAARAQQEPEPWQKEVIDSLLTDYNKKG
jgi:hypothetical protein